MTVRMMIGTTTSGVDGCGVATRRRGPARTPRVTSTTATLIPLPPTSTPTASDRVSGAVGSGEVGSAGCSTIASEVVDRDAAVDDEVRPVRPAALVGSEVDGHVDDLLGLAEAAGRVAGEADPLRLLVLHEPVHEQRRLDRPGADRVGSDAVGAELDREAPGQADDRALRRRVRVLGDAAAEERHEARDVDDRARALLDHLRDRVLATE